MLISSQLVLVGKRDYFCLSKKALVWDVTESSIKSGESHMYALVRNYSGAGAKELFDLLDERKSDVETRLRAVTGFVAYTLIRINEGGVSVTICQDQGGTDESSQVVRDWIKANAADLNTKPPTVSKGTVILHLT
jgi:hypothetical protein